MADRLDLGPLENTTGYLLRAAWRHSARTFTAYFQSVDINQQQYAILTLINGNPGCAVGDLSEPLGITPNNIVGLIGGLVKRKLVARAVHPDDRRVRTLRLTKSGEAFLRELFAIHAEYEAEYNRRLGEQRIAALCALLRDFDRL